MWDFDEFLAPELEWPCPRTFAPDPEETPAILALLAPRLDEAPANLALAQRLLAVAPDQLPSCLPSIVARNPSFQLLPLAQLLLRKAAAYLPGNPAAAEQAAGLAAAICGTLDADAMPTVRHTAALAAWVIARSILRRQAPGDAGGETPAAASPHAAAAAAAVARISTLIRGEQPSWERALAALGTAHLHWFGGRRRDADVMLMLAIYHFRHSGAGRQLAACRVQHGFLLLGTVEPRLAHLALTRAVEALAGPDTLDLAMLTALGLACCAALLEPGGAEAASHLARARALACAAPAAIAALPPPWRALIAGSAPRRAAPRDTPPAAPAAREHEGEAPVGDQRSAPTHASSSRLILRGGSPWRDLYPESLVALTDPLVLGRAEQLRREPGADPLAGIRRCPA
jgi:hypothetical protein